MKDGSRHAFLFDGNSMKDLGTFGGSGSFGNAINDSGWVTGLAAIQPIMQSHAFLWDGRRLRDLGTLGGRVQRWALPSMPPGKWRAKPKLAPENAHAFLWDGSSMHDLGTLGGSSSFSMAINAAGQVTGFSTLPGEEHQSRFSMGQRDAA